MYVTIASDSITLQEGSKITFLRGVDISTISAEAEAIPGTTNQFNWVVKISIKTSGEIASFRLKEVADEPKWTNTQEGAIVAVNALSAALKVSSGGGGGGQVDSVVAGTGIDVDSTDPTAPIVSLADTAVSAGSYTSANITIDAQGRITAAANGSGGSGTVTSVAVSGGTTGLTTSGGPITTSGTITLAGTLAVASGGTGANDASGARTNLGLGTAATANTGTGASDVPTITDADARYQAKNTSVDTVAILPPGATNWTNMPAALTFFSGQTRWAIPMDLTLKADMKLHVLMSGAGGSTNAKIRLLYRTQAAGYSTTITDYTTVGTSEVQVTIGTATHTLFSTAWIPIIAGAKDNIIMALAGIDGDGVADPGFLNIYLETR